MAEWNAVADGLPQPGVTVLAYYLNRCNKGRTIRVAWVPAKTEEASPEQDFADYDEEKDCYFTPEGWYEQIDNWDDYTAVMVHEGAITHWMALPPPPGVQGTLPNPCGLTECQGKPRCEKCVKADGGTAMNGHEPAFPRDHAHDGHNGMSLRDRIAIKALPRFLDLEITGVWNESLPDNGGDSRRAGRVARAAYYMADAMMAERSAVVPGSCKLTECQGKPRCEKCVKAGFNAPAGVPLPTHQKPSIPLPDDSGGEQP